MRAGQPVKAGAINVELFENGDAPGPGREQRGLGGDHVVVGEAAAREALRRAAHKLSIPTRIVARSEEF